MDNTVERLAGFDQAPDFILGVSELLNRLPMKSGLNNEIKAASITSLPMNPPNDGAAGARL